jgi:two-component sensor histidine kinase
MAPHDQSFRRLLGQELHSPGELQVAFRGEGPVRAARLIVRRVHLPEPCVLVIALAHVRGLLANLRQQREELEAVVAERTAALEQALRQKDAALAEKDKALVEKEHALAEKDAALAMNTTLLQEVHHRVKNNLQMLCDLLYLQMERMTDAGKAEMLRDTYRRIYVIARLHEQLYHSMESGAVTLREYLEKLVSGLDTLYPTVAIRVEVPDQRLYLDVDRAIHTGLIANELVTNAAKHAFPPDTPGQVVVGLHTVDDHVELQVRDTGRGLPPGFDVAATKSLGLRIVHILAQPLQSSKARSASRAIYNVTEGLIVAPFEMLPSHVGLQRRVTTRESTGEMGVPEGDPPALPRGDPRGETTDSR